MKTSLRTTFTLLCLAMLTACGGGGGGGQALVSDTAAGSLQQASGWSAPGESVQQQLARSGDVFARFNHFTSTPLMLDAEGTKVLLRANCDGQTCRYYGETTTHEYEFSLALANLTLTGSDQAKALASRNGVTLIQASNDGTISTGAWLHHSGFQVQSDPGPQSTDWGGLAAGDLYTFQSPNFRATWKGAMVGIPITALDKVLAGDAELVYSPTDYGGGEVDASFTDIVDVNGGTPWTVPSILFRGVPVA